MKCEVDGWIDAASTVMQVLYWTIVATKELSKKAKLSIYQLLYVPALTFDHELWVVTEKVI